MQLDSKSSNNPVIMAEEKGYTVIGERLKNKERDRQTNRQTEKEMYVRKKQIDNKIVNKRKNSQDVSLNKGTTK